MGNIEAVELSKSYLLLNHGPVTLVSSAHGDAQNVMAAAWAMPLVSMASAAPDHAHDPPSLPGSGTRRPAGCRR